MPLLVFLCFWWITPCNSFHSQTSSITKHQSLQKTIADFTCNRSPGSSWAGAGLSLPDIWQDSVCPQKTAAKHSCLFVLHHSQWTTGTQSATQILIPQALIFLVTTCCAFFSCKQQDAQCSKSISSVFRAAFQCHLPASQLTGITSDILLYKEPFHNHWQESLEGLFLLAEWLVFKLGKGTGHGG